MKKLTCNVPWFSMLVLPGGEVKPSCACGILAGNLNDQSLMEIWNGQVYIDFRKRLLDGDLSLCGDCYTHRKRHKIFPIQEGDSKDFNENMNIKASELLHGKTVLESGPVDIEMTPYYDCNVKCKMCDWHSRKGCWSPKVYSEVNKTLGYAGHLYFTGGEPLLHFEDVFEDRIVQHPSFVKNHDVSITLVTNGTLMTERFINRRLSNLPLKRVNVSVHAVTAKTYYKIIPRGKWSTVQTALNLLLELQKRKPFEVMVNFVIQKENYHELSSFVAQHEKRGIFIRLIRASGKGEMILSQEMYDSLMAEIHRSLEIALKPSNAAEIKKIGNYYNKVFNERSQAL